MIFSNNTLLRGSHNKSVLSTDGVAESVKAFALAVAEGIPARFPRSYDTEWLAVVVTAVYSWPGLILVPGYRS